MASVTETPSATTAQDNARFAIVGGLGLPAVLSLLVLVGTRWALPTEFQGDADDPVLHTFFGCAGLPFSAAAAYTLIAHPIAARAKRVLAWLWLALALVSAGYAFGGWRLVSAGRTDRVKVGETGAGLRYYASSEPRSDERGFEQRAARRSRAATPPDSETRSLA